MYKMLIFFSCQILFVAMSCHSSKSLHSKEGPAFSIDQNWTTVNENSRLLTFDLSIPRRLANDIQPIYVIKSKKKAILNFYHKTAENHIFRANISFGISLVEGEDISIVDQPDQVVYRQNGKQLSFLLEDLAKE